MTITSEKSGDVTIVTIQGKLSLGEAAASLSKTVDQLISEGNKKLIIDMSEVQYIDSSGIGTLVLAYTRLVNTGGNVVLLQPQGGVANVLTMTKLGSIFHITDDKQDAIDYLANSPD